MHGEPSAEAAPTPQNLPMGAMQGPLQAADAGAGVEPNNPRPQGVEETASHQLPAMHATGALAPPAQVEPEGQGVPKVLALPAAQKNPGAAAQFSPVADVAFWPQKFPGGATHAPEHNEVESPAVAP